MRGIIDIIIGLVFIIGGLSGHLALIGTNSGVALAIFGVVIVLFGIWRLSRSASNRM